MMGRVFRSPRIGVLAALGLALPAISTMFLTLGLGGCDTTLRQQIELYVSIKNSGVIYVYGAGGDDANPGTRDLPKKSIQNAIDLADALMDTGEVRVAEGTYIVDETLVVREGISLRGGYIHPGWAPPLYPGSEPTTTIQGEGIDTVIRPEKGVTQATVIERFTIGTADEEMVTGIWCDHSSPTIRYNYIDAANGASYSIGIYNKYSSPVINGNTITAGRGSTGAWGIWNYHASPKIWNNVIYGEAGSPDFRGVFNETGCDILLQSNTIRVGTAALDGIGIYSTDSTSLLENNIFFSTDPATGCAIYESADTPQLDELNNNDFYDCESCYAYGNPVTSFGFSGMITYLEGTTVSIVGNTDIDPRFDDSTGVNPWDWTLSGNDTDQAVSEGGNSLNTLFAHDRKADPRTYPWSMGAYEKD